MAIRGYSKGGGKVKGVGNTGNQRTKGAVQPAGTAKTNQTSKTPAHQKVNRNVGGSAPRY